MLQLYFCQVKLDAKPANMNEIPKIVTILPSRRELSEERIGDWQRMCVRKVRVQEPDGSIRDMVEVKIKNDCSVGPYVQVCIPAAISGHDLREIVSVIYSMGYTLGMHDANRF